MSPRFPVATLGLAILVQLAILPNLFADEVFITQDARRHYTRERTYDVHHTKLELSFDPEREEVSAVARITLSPILPALTGQPMRTGHSAGGMDSSAVNQSDGSAEFTGLRKVWLDAVGLKVEGVALDDGTPLSFEADDSTLGIDLGRACSARDTLTLVIAYRAHPRLGLYFTKPDKAYPKKARQVWTQGEMEESSHWFPCFNAPNEMFTSELVATVPERMMVISNGALVATDHDPKAKTKRYHWREDHPHATYLTSCVVGEFAELKDEWDGIAISSYVAPDDLPKALRSFGKTASMMEFFSTRIGYRYPYAKYAQTTVEDFRWGGMENLDATTLTRRTLHDSRHHLDGSSDQLVAHELAHQWWGDLLTARNWSHVWLNEGFATYFDYLFTEHDRGADEFLERIHSGREDYFAQDSSDYRRPVVTDVYENAEQMFDRHAYQKGAQVLHMLRYVLGDEIWWQVISRYAHTHAHGNVDTEDLRRVVEAVSGQPLEWFFDQWLYHAGYPEYEVSATWSEADRALSVSVAQKQKVDTLTPYFRMPVEIEVTTASGVSRYRFDLKEPVQTMVFPLLEPPEVVEFDPEDWILKKLKFTKTKQELVTQLAKARTTASRKRAAEWLSAFPAELDAASALAAALQHDSAWGVRARAALSLGEVRTPPARTALLSALNTEPESRARQKIIKALGKFKDDEQVSAALWRQFELDSSYACQVGTMKSLVEMNSPKAYDACLRGLDYSSHEEIVRVGALESLAKLGDPRGVDAMIKWTAYGLPPAARLAAVESLGKIAAKVPDRKEAIRDHLVKLLDDPHFRMARTAIDALGDVKDAAAVDAIEGAALRTAEFRTRHRAQLAVAKIRKAVESDAALATVKDELATVRKDYEGLLQRLELLERNAVAAPSGDQKPVDASVPKSDP